MLSPFSAFLQYLLPKAALTRVAGRLARAHGGTATTWAIRRFITRYGVDMQEAADPDPAHYDTFNDFFTRSLRADARPLAQADYLCPVDGAISQFGDVTVGRILQAKGHTYSVQALLAGDAQLAQPFTNGQFATLYLSPRDYHRIHMPCAGRLTQMIHVPGSLFSVNPATARAIRGLFARNERLICLFDTARGPLALVLVGATIVGSMATTWHGVVNPPRPGHIRRWTYQESPIDLPQGAELGRFLLGSTVIVLWPRGTLRFDPSWSPGATVRMGQALGTAREAKKP